MPGVGDNVVRTAPAAVYTIASTRLGALAGPVGSLGAARTDLLGSWSGPAAAVAWAHRNDAW